jgi:hypothetical protein
MKATSIKALQFLVVSAVTGCGGGPKLEFAEVDGKVTLQGKPLSGVMVRFYPVEGGREQLPLSAALTDAGGAYSMRHDGDQPGALVGRSRAVISWPSRDLLGAGRDKPASTPANPPIPLRYTVASETPLLVEVKAGERQTIDLSLED